MTEKQKAYIAGIIDGEGTIVIQKMFRTAKRYNGKASYAMHVAVEMGCREVPEFLIKTVGRGSLYSRKRPDRKRIMYSWRVSGKDAAYFLQKIKKELVLKIKEAEIAIEFQKTMIFKGRGNPVTKEILKIRDRLFQRLKKIHYAL